MNSYQKGIAKFRQLEDLAAELRHIYATLNSEAAQYMQRPPVVEPRDGGPQVFISNETSGAVRISDGDTVSMFAGNYRLMLTFNIEGSRVHISATASRESEVAVQATEKL